MGTKWEYDVINVPLKINDAKKLLEHMSAKKWEIITIIHEPHLTETGKPNGVSGYVIYVKKPSDG